MAAVMYVCYVESTLFVDLDAIKLFRKVLSCTPFRHVHMVSSIRHISISISIQMIIMAEHLKVSMTPCTGIHTQKAYTHSGTSPMQILLLLAHAYMYMHFA